MAKYRRLEDINQDDFGAFRKKIKNAVEQDYFMALGRVLGFILFQRNRKERISARTDFSRALCLFYREIMAGNTPQNLDYPSFLGHPDYLKLAISVYDTKRSLRGEKPRDNNPYHAMAYAFDESKGWAGIGRIIDEAVRECEDARRLSGLLMEKFLRNHS
jgi:hypothetical protein